MRVRARSIHQIEITSRCDLRCVYCPHRSMERAKIDMTREIYMQALKQAQFLNGDSQNELNLAGTGESTLHPDFVEYVHLAREAMPHITLVMATNGLNIAKDPGIAKAIASTGIRVFVSLHRPEKAGPAIEALKSAGIYAGSSTDPSENSVNWAGQVKWAVTSQLKGSVCPWIRDGWLMVLSDGRITHCSFDCIVEEPIGTIWDDLSNAHNYPYKLCETCHLNVA